MCRAYTLIYQKPLIRLAAWEEDWSANSSVLSICIELCTQYRAIIVTGTLFPDQFVVHPQLINTFMTLPARGRAVHDGTHYPADLRFDPTPEARARQHLLGDDGLAPYISRLTCRSFNVLYQCCFRRRKIHVGPLLESAGQLSEYLLTRLVES